MKTCSLGGDLDSHICEHFATGSEECTSEGTCLMQEDSEFENNLNNFLNEFIDANNE